MKILVGYVRTPEGEAALARAIQEASLRAAELVVVHSERGGERGETERSIADSKELAAVRAKLEAAGVHHSVRELVRGKEPGDDLVDFANEIGAELIVLGLRRRSPVGKLVLGSTTQDVLLGADCPVLTVSADNSHLSH
ncbi:MAG TPA: universal stress protein [Jiangellaceae bacterium]